MINTNHASLKPKVMIRTPHEIKQQAQQLTAKMIAEIYAFIEEHEIPSENIGSKLKTSGAAIRHRKTQTVEPKLSKLIEMVLAIEDLTGVRFESTSFVRQKPASNSRYLGKIKEK